MRVTNTVVGLDAKEKMMAGIDKVADAVESTLGPAGRHVAIQKVKGQPPHVTKDGVTVADSFKALSDPYEDMGAQLLKQAAQRTAAIAGDGTTTSTVLARAMVKSGFKALKENNLNAVQLKREMDEATNYVVGLIKQKAKNIDINSPELDSVATISTNNDDALGMVIADAIRIAGENGIVSVGPSNTNETYATELIGMGVDKGFIDDKMINDTENSRVVYLNPVILTYPKKISDIREIGNLLDECMKAKRPLLIIADNVDSSALGGILINQDRIKSCAIKLPHYGSQSLEMLNDIAVVVGGKVISEDFGIELSKTTIAMCGSAEKVIVTRESTVIINGKGDKEGVEKRVTQLKNFLASDTIKSHEIDIVTKRIARIQGVSAVIHIGAPTDVERREKADRVDDALRATRAALEEGIVPGAGNMLAWASERLLREMPSTGGYEIIFDALLSPMSAIVRNAGVSEEKITQYIQEGIRFNVGYDFTSEDFSCFSLLENRIADPAKVVRAALQNANSVAGMILTTECLLSEDEEDKNKK